MADKRHSRPELTEAEIAALIDNTSKSFSHCTKLNSNSERKSGDTVQVISNE